MEYDIFFSYPYKDAEEVNLILETFMTLVDTHEHKNGYNIHTKNILELGSVSAPLHYKKFIQLNPDTKVEKNMGQIFISYARDDDEPFVKQL